MRDESVPVHRVDGIGQVSVPVRTFDFWTLVSHPFFEKDFEVATMQKELAYFGPGLGPGGFAFREPFANLSRISRLKNDISETKCLCKGVFYNFCQSCRVPLPIVRTWDNTKHESCGNNSARKTTKYEYYIFVNSEWYSDLSQTLRRAFAAFRHCSKTHTSISADVTRILKALHGF